MVSTIFLIIQGFLAKLITGADDTLTHTPIIASVARSKKGKLIFILGMLLSILTLIGLSMFFGGLLQKIPYRNLFAAGLLLILAGFVYHSKFIHKPREKFEHLARKEVKVPDRLPRLFGIGFITFFATGIDDVLVYSALLLKSFSLQLMIALGILIAALLEFYVIFYFSKIIAKIKHKEILTIVGLIVIAALVGFQVI